MDVLASHLNHIATTLAGIEQQRESEPRLAADWMRRLKTGDVILPPCLVTRALGLLTGDAERRIFGDAALARPSEHRAHGVQEIALRERRTAFH